MKKTFILLFFSTFIYSQNKISFNEVNKTIPELSNSFKSYKILEIDESLENITDGAKITVNYINDYSFTLKENRLLGSDYSVIIKEESGKEIKKNIYDLGFDGKYYQNANSSFKNQIALSIFENQYTLFIKKEEKVFYIEPLQKFDKTAAANNYVYYEVKDIINDTNLNCPQENDIQANLNENRTQIIEPNLGCKTVELNMCIDYSFYATYTSINAAINRTFEILNLTQLDYTIANGLENDVNFKVKRHYILTCNNCNYWPSTVDLLENNGNFNQFVNYSKMFDSPSDIRIFWQSVGFGGSALGYGTQPDNYNCTTANLVTVRQVSIRNMVAGTGTNTTRLVLSHEFGHNFGCPHVGGFNSIMAATSYYGNLWADSSKIIINTSLNLSNCYYNCQTELCFNKRVENSVVNIDDSNKIINFNWLSETGIEYKVRLYNYATNTWSAYTTINYPTNTIAFNYNNDTTTCSNKYKIEIVPVCQGTNGISQVLVITIPDVASPNLSFESIVQNENLCVGLPYTFSVNAQYPGNSPVYQWKINNNNVGSNSSSFTTSFLQNNDVLSCEIVSDEPCLLSQSAIVSKTVTVSPPPCNLSNNQFEIEEVEFFPNPVADQFTIKSIHNINNISLYNILGQKLFENTNNTNETTLDLSFLPSSTYLVKIEFDNYTRTIKIVKE